MQNSEARISKLEREISSLNAKISTLQVPTNLRLYLPKEVCSIAKCSRNHLEKWIRMGLIVPFKPDPNGRKIYIRQTDLEKLLSSNVA
jgi:hypothetical protein